MPKSKRTQPAISDEEIIAALMNSGTINEAAALAGISPRTIYDRMAAREFRVLYSAAKADVLRTAALELNKRLTDAVQTIAEIMRDKDNGATARLQAAQTILKNAVVFADRVGVQEGATSTATIDPFSLEIDKL